MSITRMSSGAVIAAAAAVVALGAPAHADSYVVRDARHDMVGQPVESEGTPTTPAPRMHDGDVVRFRATYGHQRVRIALTYAVLTRPDRGTLVAHVASIRTAEATVEIGILARHRTPGGHSFWDSSGRCAGMRSHIDYRHDRATLSVPRGCLGDPRWVRVGGGLGQLVGGLTDGRLYSDDAQLDGRVVHNLAFGPRVRR